MKTTTHIIKISKITPPPIETEITPTCDSGWVGVNGNAQFCTPDDDAPDNDAEVPDIITINNGLLYAPLSGSVGIGTATPTHALNVVGTTNFTGNSIFGGSTITLDTSGATTINQKGIQLLISQTNAAGNSLVDIQPISSDGSSQGLIRFFRLLSTTSANSAFQILPGDNTGNVVHDFRIKTGTTTVFNEQGYDMDFRFEGDNNANLLFLDLSLELTHGIDWWWVQPNHLEFRVANLWQERKNTWRQFD